MTVKTRGKGSTVYASVLGVTDGLRVSHFHFKEPDLSRQYGLQDGHPRHDQQITHFSMVFESSNFVVYKLQGVIDTRSSGPCQVDLEDEDSEYTNVSSTTDLDTREDSELTPTYMKVRLR